MSPQKNFQTYNNNFFNQNNQKPKKPEKKEKEVVSLKLSIIEKIIPQQQEKKLNYNQNIPQKQKSSNSLHDINQEVQYFQSQEIVEFEHIATDQFKGFLHNHEQGLQEFIQKQTKTYKKNDPQHNIQMVPSNQMILLKFLYPKNDCNQMIKVIWSPNFRLITRRENVNSIHNKDIPLSDRFCTFEGPEYLMKQDSTLSPVIAEDIEMVCQNINQHIGDITGNNMQIQTMSLYFKIDDYNRLLLLFCTYLKIKDTKLAFNSIQTRGKKRYRQISPLMVTCKERVYQQENQETNKNQNINNNMEHGQNLNLKKNVCTNCENLQPDLVKLQYKYIVESFQKKLVKNEDTYFSQQQKLEIQKNQKLKDFAQEHDINKNKKYFYKTKEQDQQDNLDFINNELRQEECDFEDIPALIQKVWGKMTVNSYQKLIKNVSWLSNYTKVCDNCYLQYTKHVVEDSLQRNVKQQRIEFMRNLELKHQELQLQEIQDHDAQQRLNNQNQRKFQLPIQRQKSIKILSKKGSTASSNISNEQQLSNKITNKSPFSQYIRQSKNQKKTTQINQEYQLQNISNNSQLNLSQNNISNNNFSQHVLDRENKRSLNLSNHSSTNSNNNLSVNNIISKEKKTQKCENKSEEQNTQQEIYLNEYFQKQNQNNNNSKNNNIYNTTRHAATSQNKYRKNQQNYFKNNDNQRNIKTQSSPRFKELISSNKEYQLDLQSTVQNQPFYSANKSNKFINLNSTPQPQFKRIQQSRESARNIYTNRQMIRNQSKESAKKISPFIKQNYKINKTAEKEYMTSTASSFTQQTHSSFNQSFSNPLQQYYANNQPQNKQRNQYNLGIKTISSIKNCAKSLDIDLNDLNKENNTNYKNSKDIDLNQ